MKKTISLFIFILLFLHVSIGQTEYEVVKDNYLKANPDSYSDNLMLIPAGIVVKKDIASDYPFIRITYNGEVGYVSLNDLAPLNKSENIDEIIEDTPPPPPPPPPPTPPLPPPPTPLKTDYSLFLNKILSQIYLLVIIPILFFLLFIWKFLRLKSILKDAKQNIEKSIANIQKTKPIVESTKSKISNIIDLININNDLNSLKYHLIVLNSSNHNAINNLVSIELEIRSIAEVIDATSSIKEALEVRNRSEILKSKIETALRDASDEKSVVEKEIDACIEKVKGLTISAANKAISDAELAKIKIRNAYSDISETNSLIDNTLASSKKYKSNLSTALNIALTKLESLKTNSDELKSEAEAVYLKANKAISDANATSKGVVFIQIAVDAKIAAERGKVSAADTLVEANLVKSKSETLKSNGEFIKTEVNNAIKDIRIKEIPEPPKVGKIEPIINLPIINEGNKRTDWDKYRKTLEKWGITKLYHFTDSDNIPSIKKNGGILSFQYCTENNIEIKRRGGSDLSTQLDREKGLQNYVRLSFVKEHPMLHVARNDGRIVNPVILEISLDLVYLSDTLFSNQNAAKRDVIVGKTFQIFNSIKFNVFDKQYFELTNTEKPFYQAEVLVLKKVPLKFITNLNF